MGKSRFTKLEDNRDYRTGCLILVENIKIARLKPHVV